jgi:hypothetical protein
VLVFTDRNREPNDPGHEDEEDDSTYYQNDGDTSYSDDDSYGDDDNDDSYGDSGDDDSHKVPPDANENGALNTTQIVRRRTQMQVQMTSLTYKTTVKSRQSSQRGTLMMVRKIQERTS